MTISTIKRHQPVKIEFYLGNELDSQSIDKYGPIYEKVKYFKRPAINQISLNLPR